MSNVSIYEKNWINLVFEGRNKAYGAYQLRQENAKTSLIALLGGVTFFVGAIGLGLFLTSFGEATEVIDENPDVIIQVDNFTYPPKKKNEPEKKVIPLTEKNEPSEKVESKDLVDPVIVESKEATDVIIKNTDLDKPKTDDPNPNGGNATGTIATPGGGNTTGGTKGTNDGETDIVIKTNELDKLPKYPGGMDKFYDYVARKFVSPEISDDGEITMSVIMSFVIEKDGTLTDIKALRGNNKEVEKEAIRLLKASKVKWEPGIKDGKPVRTLFMLPIKVKI